METKEEFLQDGLLDQYCLGLLPDEQAAAITKAAAKNKLLQQKIMETEKALAAANPVTPANLIKQTILKTLQNLNSDNDIPVINYASSVHEWNERFGHIRPAATFENMQTNFLKDTPDLQICIAWLSGTLHEEGHDSTAFQESFLILEGSCQCNIGGKIFNLKAGDYLDIPFSTPHTITATSEKTGYVKAVIQRKKKAA
jgi:hypothetical protein